MDLKWRTKTNSAFNKIRFLDCFLRLLHKKFLALPAQAIKARLFGVTEIKIEELTALVSSQNMHGLFCTILKQEDSKLDVSVAKLYYYWLSEVSIECKLINENCSAPLIEDLVDYMKIEIPSYGPEINDQQEASKKLHEAFRRLFISMTKCNNTITVERPMLKRSKRKLPCVKRAKKEPVLETIYEEQNKNY